jgi:hypothetical protein
MLARNNGLTDEQIIQHGGWMCDYSIGIPATLRKAALSSCIHCRPDESASSVLPGTLNQNVPRSIAFPCCTLAGLPIRPIFSKPLPGRKQLRKRLGLDTGLPAVLLVGGGEGMGKLEETVAQLDAQLGDKAQVSRGEQPTCISMMAQQSSSAFLRQQA